jgi:ferric-dicitrate binding protein FerR (iron transport regulator)
MTHPAPKFCSIQAPHWAYIELDSITTPSCCEAEQRLICATTPARHFELAVGGVTVQDVGTVFAVSLQPDGEILVTVEKGIVKLAVPHEPSQRLTASQEALIRVAVRTQTLPAEEIAQRLSWRQPGTLLSQELSIGEIVRQLNARNPAIQIQVLDPAIAGRSMGLAVSTSTPAEFVDHLRHFYPDIIVTRCKSNSGATLLEIRRSSPGQTSKYKIQKCTPEKPYSR